MPATFCNREKASARLQEKEITSAGPDDTTLLLLRTTTKLVSGVVTKALAIAELEVSKPRH
jgi:hypothetical protein